MNEHNEAHLRSLADAWNNQDLHRIVALFTEDCRYEDLALGESHLGRSGVQSFAESVYVTMPDFHLEFREIDAATDVAATAWTISATWNGDFSGAARTGTPVEFSGISRYRFVDGSISLNVDCWDSVQLIRQLGVLPADLAELAVSR